MIEMVRTDYAQPIHWGANQPGMQADNELQEPSLIRVKSLWCEAANKAADIAELMMAEGAHKQIVNRILEPFQWISVIVTATEWDNFFTLRDHPDAQPEIQALAKAMKQVMNNSKPVDRDWHLPYISREERLANRTQDLLKMSAARCARVSYLTHEGKEPSLEEDFKLYDRLVGSEPRHSSPIEHQAYVGDSKRFYNNFRGWVQNRYVLENS
jgi:thymidylate synthase ThyX